MSLAARHAGAFPAGLVIPARWTCAVKMSLIRVPVGQPTYSGLTAAPSGSATADGTARPAPTQARPADRSSRAPARATEASAGSGSSGMASVRFSAANHLAAEPDQRDLKTIGVYLRGQGHRAVRVDREPVRGPTQGAAGRTWGTWGPGLVSTWIRPSAWSSAATAPAVARVTPRLAPRAARVGARPPWISARAGPSWVRPLEVLFPWA